MKRKISTMLIISLLFGIFLCLPAQVVLAEEGDEQEVTQTLNLKWNFYPEQYPEGNGYYNPADKGKSVSFTYFLIYKDKTTGKYSRSEAMTYTGTIGTDYTVQIPRVKVDDVPVIYEDCQIVLDAGNKLYTGSGNLPNEETLVLDIYIKQSMNLSVVQKLADGLILNPAEEIPIQYTVAKTEKGQLTYPLTGRRRNEIIEAEVNFEPGSLFLWSEGNFRRAMNQGALEPFNPYTGRSREFELRAEFAGDQADALKERYNLTVAGNDLDGWTVTLSAKEVPQKMAELTFDPVEGHWENGSQDPVKMRVPVRDTITIPAGPTLDGHNFAYWEGSVYHPGDSYTVVGDHTFTARYEEYPEIIVNAPIVLDKSGTITVPLDQPQASSPQAQAPVAVLQDDVRALPATGSAQSSSLIIDSLASTLQGILLQHTR